MTAARLEYEEKGFVLLPDLLPEEIVSALLSIMQVGMGATLEQQKRFLSAPDMPLLPVRSYEMPSNLFPFSLAFLWGLTPIMEQTTGKSLLPSYAWGRVYPKGGLCVVHNDRRSNEHSMNLTLDYSDDLIWDFCVAKDRLGEEMIDHRGAYKDFGDLAYERIKMKPGDAVAYQGPKYYHGRIDPNPNTWSAHLFLGWVDRNGPYKDHAFDTLEPPPPAQFFFD